MVALYDYYRDKGLSNLGHIPEDDDPQLIDYPISSDFAMHYVMKGYQVPERMVRFRDSADRRRYLQWLRGEQVEDRGEIASLRREIARLRLALEDGPARPEPKQETRQTPARLPQTQPKAFELQAKPKPRRLELE